ncbi:MAG TPA: hypothetical protein VEA69_10870 [Tepidisphaeraceae bacterium]|nr:hypothetical protein [Tepidisphaeraceae bacterium]
MPTAVARRRSRTSRLARVLLALVLACTATLPATAKAPVADEEEIVNWEGRLDGYPHNARVESNSRAMAWFMIAFLTAIGVAVLFKNSNRTHLD